MGDRVLSEDAPNTFDVIENETIAANFAMDEIIDKLNDTIYNENQSIASSKSFDNDVNLVYKVIFEKV